jgi:predicted dienelactone hydrolase
MIRRLSIITLAALTAFACATGDSGRGRNRDRDDEADNTPHARYSSEAGSSPVGVIPDATLRDTKRQRDVALTIDYPITAGPHPLIIFSHGYGTNGHSYVGLSTHWASNGYVVVKPTHASDNMIRLADLTPNDFRDRVADIRFVLDSLDALEQNYPELKGKIDHTKIGVGGHSLGALTAMLIAGTRTFPGPQSYADPRVKAVIAMSPQGPRESWGLTKESWAEVRVPVMFMTGDRDQGIDESETPDWRRQAFELSPAGDKWLVFVQGAGHLAFTGRLGVMPEDLRVNTPSAQPPEPRTDPFAPPVNTQPQQQGRPMAASDPIRGISGTIKALSLAFWDAYLGGNAAGREQLDKAGDRGGVELKTK